MINVSSWSIKNPIPGVLLFIMLTAVGAMSFRAMKIQNFPDIDLPTVIVTAALPGASPSQLETDVARKIETGRRFGDRIEVTGGLGPDARVVAMGGGFLAEGDTVRVVDTPAAMNGAGASAARATPPKP